jgi:hypothetical protein
MIMLKGKVQQQQTSMCCSYDTIFKFVLYVNCLLTPAGKVWRSAATLLGQWPEASWNDTYQHPPSGGLKSALCHTMIGVLQGKVMKKTRLLCETFDSDKLTQ